MVLHRRLTPRRLDLLRLGLVLATMMAHLICHPLGRLRRTATATVTATTRLPLRLPSNLRVTRGTRRAMGHPLQYRSLARTSRQEDIRGIRRTLDSRRIQDSRHTQDSRRTRDTRARLAVLWALICRTLMLRLRMGSHMGMGMGTGTGTGTGTDILTHRPVGVRSGGIDQVEESVMNVVWNCFEL